MRHTNSQAQPDRANLACCSISTRCSGEHANAIAIRREVPAPILHASLERHHKGRAKSTGTAPPSANPLASRTPLLVMLAVMVVCALIADTHEEAWPLAILMALPLIALGYDLIARWRTPSPGHLQRPARIIADLRPVLLRPVLVVPQGRPARIIAKLPRLLTQLPARPARRSSKIIGRVRLLSRLNGL